MMSSSTARKSFGKAVLAVGIVALIALPVMALAQTAGGIEPARTAPWLDLTLHWIIRSIEFAGIGAIVIGSLAAIAVYVRHVLSFGTGEDCYKTLRTGIGRSILLGLEFLVAADIINTVAIEPTLQSVLLLGGIVLIRTFLSFALEVEIDGRLPWRKGDTTR